MRKNIYMRSALRLEESAARARREGEKAEKIWALVAHLTRDELLMLEELVKDELHGDDD